MSGTRVLATIGIALALITGAVSANTDTPVTVPATDEEPVPCGIDAAAPPCVVELGEAPQYPAPMDADPTVSEPIAVSALPMTGSGPGGSAGWWFGILSIAVSALAYVSVRAAERAFDASCPECLP